MIQDMFWFFVLLILYVYFGYPLLLLILSKFRPASPVQKADITPTVSLIIAAYNEEKIIAQKIENSLALDYPREKLEIIVASDGSTDETNRIVRDYSDRGIRLVCHNQNRGKSSIQNRTMGTANGEIVVFSDAPTMCRVDALKELVANFADDKIGCVGRQGACPFRKETAVAEGIDLYSRYDTFLKKKESDLGCLCMVSGWLFGFRRELYQPLPDDVGDDFVLPMVIREQGYRVVLEPKAIAQDVPAVDMRGRFKQHVRIITKDLRGLFYKRALLNPFRFGLVSIGLLSHKLLRWLVPLFLIGIFIANSFLLNHWFYRVTLAFQVSFYFTAAVGAILQARGVKPMMILCVPLYFCLANSAALWGVFNFIAGRRMGRWQPQR